jgi:hypothetical protein
VFTQIYKTLSNTNLNYKNKPLIGCITNIKLYVRSCKVLLTVLNISKSKEKLFFEKLISLLQNYENSSKNKNKPLSKELSIVKNYEIQKVGLYTDKIYNYIDNDNSSSANDLYDELQKLISWLNEDKKEIFLDEIQFPKEINFANNNIMPKII